MKILDHDTGQKDNPEINREIALITVRLVSPHQKRATSIPFQLFFLEQKVSPALSPSSV